MPCSSLTSHLCPHGLGWCHLLLGCLDEPSTASDAWMRWERPLHSLSLCLYIREVGTWAPALIPGLVYIGCSGMGGACGLCGWVGATLPKTMEDGERESWSTPQMGALGGAGNGKSLAPTVPTWGPAGVAVCLWIGGLLAQALGG